jgi:hypothetical protein
VRATAGSGGVVLRTRDERNLEKVIQPSRALKILAPSLSYRLEWAKEWFYCCHATPNKANAAMEQEDERGAEGAG